MALPFLKWTADKISGDVIYVRAKFLKVILFAGKKLPLLRFSTHKYKKNPEYKKKNSRKQARQKFSIHHFLNNSGFVYIIPDFFLKFPNFAIPSPDQPPYDLT